MSAEELRLTTRDDALIVRPAFEIDLSTAGPLGERITAATPADCRGVILDLTDVSFIDSYGIYILVGVSNRLAAQGQSLTLVVPEGSPVLGTFQISNVKSVLEVVPSVDDALAALGSQRQSRQAGL